MCPLMLSKATGRLQTVPDLRDGGRDEPECLEDSTVKTHQCFSKCLSWMENHPDAGEDIDFDVGECPQMQDVESKDPCILFDSDEEP
ncbi:hypothetical protein AAVH_16922 [Aphelenchoides avenae]|nr:hypothetical protein AAVH_16922 [Aphelenchus avenae]